MPRAGAALRHIVASYALIYHDGRHIYLDAYCYSCPGEAILHYNLYHSDKIMPETLKALTDWLPPDPLPRRTH